MGSSSSSATTATGKHVLEAKLDSATKTGVLNLADQNLRSSSTFWLKLNNPSINIKLKTLDISGNSIKTLPVEVYAMINLKTLIAAKCNVQRTYDMTMLNKLTNLKIDHNDLENEKLGNVPTSLAKLNLSFNHFSGIPNALINANHIITLELNSNRIVSLTGIGSLTALVDLYLDDNLLSELPEEISQCTKITLLSLKRNRFTVRKNSVQFIPEAFLTSTSVESIDLEGNPDLCKADVLSFRGVDEFLERRKSLKDKNLSGGALMDYSLFGLKQ